MDIFRTRLVEAMESRGVRATDLARETGLSKARISQYVNGKYIPKSDAVLAIARVLEVSPLWLMGENDAPTTVFSSQSAPSEPVSHPAEATAAPDSTPSLSLPREPIPRPANVVPLHLCRYPILGEIACGRPIFADEDRDGGYVTAAEEDADFCLTAKGNSMIGARICDGDKVFIRQTDMVDNGEIAAVVVDDDEATLKRVYYYPDEEKLVLMPENADYEPMVYIGEALNHIHILGKAVAVQAKVR